MDLDFSPTSRKRRRSSTNNKSDGDGNNGNEDIRNETPSKRLENSHGHPIPRKTYHLNTHLILQSLALTRLYVTSNFSLYNPPTSPIIICVTREDDSLYRELCTILPSLYPIASNLQALCIMPAEQTSTDLWTTLQRVVPICTMADLDEEASDAVHTFFNETAELSPDLIILFDSAGKGVWSSEDLPLESQREWDGGTILRTGLAKALRRLMMPKEGDGDGEAMDTG